MRLRLLALCMLLAAFSQSQAASLVRLQLVTDGASSFPGDQLRLSVLFRPGEMALTVELRAYQSLPPQAEGAAAEIRSIAGRGSSFRDAKGNFLLKRTLSPDPDKLIHELVIEVPYESLDLSVGRHRIGYEVTALRGEAVEFVTATAMSFLEVLEQPRLGSLTRLRHVLETVRVTKPVFVVQPDGTIVEETEEVEETRLAPAIVPDQNKTRYLRPGDPAGLLPEIDSFFQAQTADGRIVSGHVVNSQRFGDLTLYGIDRRVVTLGAAEIESIQTTRMYTSASLPDAQRQQMFVAGLNHRPWVPQPRVPIYFATNRDVAQAASTKPDRFGNELASLSYGSCQVSIPLAVHRRGRLERTRWWESSDPAKHFLVEQVGPLTADAFLTLMKRALSNQDDDDVLLYVHGYANSFESCLLTSARLKHDTEFTGPVIAFSWPSEGSRFDWFNPKGPYERDETKAEKSHEALASVLLKLVDQRAAETGKIHVLAHSMGNRVALEALRTVDEKLPPGKKPFGHVVFAAPDVDVRTFVEAFPSALRRSDDATLYFCEDDVALKTSRKIHDDSRVGQYRLMIDGLQNVDCRNANTSWIGHGYIVDRDILLVDLQMLLTLHRQPPDRRPPLGERVHRNKKYWYFP